jgi:hypothetical protein
MNRRARSVAVSEIALLDEFHGCSWKREDADQALLKRKYAPRVRLIFNPRQPRNMSADRGRPEAAGQRPERREQP